MCVRTFDRGGHDEQSITMPVTRPKRRVGRDPDGRWSFHSARAQITDQTRRGRQLSFAAFLSFYPF